MISNSEFQPVSISLNQEQYDYLKLISELGYIPWSAPICREVLFRELKDMGMISFCPTREPSLVYGVDEDDEKATMPNQYHISESGKMYILQNDKEVSYKKLNIALLVISIILSMLSVLIALFK